MAHVHSTNFVDLPALIHSLVLPKVIPPLYNARTPKKESQSAECETQTASEYAEKSYSWRVCRVAALQFAVVVVSTRGFSYHVILDSRIAINFLPRDPPSSSVSPN